MNKLISVAFILFAIISCKQEKSHVIDVSNIEVSVIVDRFEQQFYTSNDSTLQGVKSKYPYLFPINNPDSIWLHKINDKNEILLFQKTQQIFEDFSNEEKQIKSLFQHVKYYHPTFKSPKIITLITDLDYNNKVMYADSLLFVSLDMYLGKNDEVYMDFPPYLSKNYEKSQLVVDIAKSISEKYLQEKSTRQFMDIIVSEGKKLYMVDCYLPEVIDSQKIGYTQNELDWINMNEAQIWKYFIENKLLYSTDAELNKRFVEDAPFSKFYIDIDKDSPGRVGVWLGWQIVRSYMNNNSVTLQQLLQTSGEEIFKNSKYKPKK